MRPLVIGFLLFAAIIAAGASLTGRLRSNAGFLSLNHALAENPDRNVDQAGERFARAIRWSGPTPSVWRGQGLTAFENGRMDLARDALASAGWTEEEFRIKAGHLSPREETADVLGWYGLALSVAPEETSLWLEIGQACQWNWTADALCREYLARNGGNLLVDPAFLADGSLSWQVPRDPAVRWQTVTCEQDTRFCGQLTILAPDLNPSAGPGQCLQLESGARYRFSAWLKVDTAPDALWRPLYIQGTIGGKPDGLWPGDQTGSSDWRFWEQAFTAPDYDDSRACFYPVRMGSRGTILIYEPELIAISD